MSIERIAYVVTHARHARCRLCKHVYYALVMLQALFVSPAPLYSHFLQDRQESCRNTKEMGNLTLVVSRPGFPALSNGALYFSSKYSPIRIC